MLSKYAILMIVSALLVASLIASAQQKPASPSAQDKEARFAKLFEKAERTLKVTVKAKDQYRAGEDVNVDVLLTNTGIEPLATHIWNQYLQEEPKLVKDGQSVPYRKDKDVSFEGKARVADFNPRKTGVNPQQTTKVRDMNLLDWYGTLEPGTYQLTVGHRFWLKGKPIKSNAVTFEIVP